MAVAGLGRLFRADKTESNLLVLFIPSKDRNGRAIRQKRWVTNALEFLGSHLGGATAFPRGQGVWRDDSRGGILLFDEPVVIQCYTSLARLKQNANDLRDLLIRLGTATNQAAVGCVIDRHYLEIRLPE